MTVFLDQYKEPEFDISEVSLQFELGDPTIVSSEIRFVRRNPSAGSSCVLYGKDLKLLSLEIEGKRLEDSEYIIEADQLTIHTVPNKFTLKSQVEISPQKNLELMGLYESQGIICTQCEPEGFRKITYYLDRPDVLSVFKTTIVADKKSYPVLLSNGNCIAKGEEGDRHWVTWLDPHPKPSYLFALVAGNLACLEDTYLTKTGRLVTLKIYSDFQYLDHCQYAMEALKKAFSWDERTYDREYDLDLYMIVAIQDFNMGAMENKGLNIFNAKYIYVRPETATDLDYELIDAVVGHEYFHNWSGNRVTCRDWFQLSLKEGLTVFREQHFVSDIHQSPVHLIDNVQYLREHQFSEDASAMSHPVQPDCYEEIDNFYTATVYEKGAQIIRMIKNYLAWDTFKKCMNHYFEKFDGQAVTIQDFLACMKSESSDSPDFERWYKQAGTPIVKLQTQYDSAKKTYSINIEQKKPEVFKSDQFKCLPIPFHIGLIDETGKQRLDTILLVDTLQKRFDFLDQITEPKLSVLRNFSAPIRVEYPQQTEKDLAFLLNHDSDPFAQWDAGQNLAIVCFTNELERMEKNQAIEGNSHWMLALKGMLERQDVEKSIQAKMLSLPTLALLMNHKPGVRIEHWYSVLSFYRKQLAEDLNALLTDLYTQNQVSGIYQFVPRDCASRLLRDQCLKYLNWNDREEGIAFALEQWDKSNCMTDQVGALNALISRGCSERELLLDKFYHKWQHAPLILDKWFRLQALSELPDTLSVVKSLKNHSAFNIKNPNKVYSLIGAFCGGNLLHFHDISGQGYQFLAEVVLEIDAFNPPVAAKMLKNLSNWKLFDVERQKRIYSVLENIQKTRKISKNVSEVVGKSLET